MTYTCQSEQRDMPNTGEVLTLSLWVAGAAVSGQYADAREEARDHARLRNMYFQQVLTFQAW